MLFRIRSRRFGALKNTGFITVTPAHRRIVVKRMIPSEERKYFRNQFNVLFHCDFARKRLEIESWSRMLIRERAIRHDQNAMTNAEQLGQIIRYDKNSRTRSCQVGD